MLINIIKTPPVALFLFAHQDDEFGIFQQIVIEKMRGSRVICIYFTNGVVAGGDSSRRNRESLSVLADLGVDKENIFFVGDILSIDDGCLVDNLLIASEWLGVWIKESSFVASVYIAAWEGGHPDHDLLHAIALQLLHERQMVHLVQQFSLYNSYHCRGPFYRVLFPIKNNGIVNSTAISWKNRFRFLKLCLHYPSQTKSWIGIFPFVLLHYIIHGSQMLQPVSIIRTQERPHDGELYYEKRKFSSWHLVESRISQWRAARKSN
jgi:LmbE family N-acetylglucosaminyl deacetylase